MKILISYLLFFQVLLGVCQSQLAFPQRQKQLLATTEKYKVKEILLTGAIVDMTWTSTNVTNQFNYFNSLTGEGAYYLVYNDKLQPNSTMPHVNNAIFILLDPKYIDQKMAVISVPINQSFNEATENWQGSSKALVQLYDNLKLQGEMIEVPNTNFIINETYTYLNSTLFSFTSVMHPPTYDALLPWLMMIPTILMLVSMYFVTKAQIPGMKISLLTLFINLNFLLFVSLLQLYYGVMSIHNAQGWLILCGVVTFSTVIRFVQCFQAVIRRINGIRGYLQFYILTFLYLWCLFNFGTSSWFAIVNSLFLLPQIVHNAYQGIRPGFYLSYIFTIMLSQSYMLYYKGSPDNVMSLSPNYYVCIGIIISIILQMAFLFVQHKCGARFFIPKRCIPGYYNYIEVVEFDLTTRLMSEDCTICLLPLSEEPGTDAEFQSGKKSQQFVESKVTKRIMKTPCNHRFHVKCLQTWMQHKMECPVDRSKLPPLEI